MFSVKSFLSFIKTKCPHSGFPCTCYYKIRKRKFFFAVTSFLGRGYLQFWINCCSSRSIFPSKIFKQTSTTYFADFFFRGFGKKLVLFKANLGSSDHLLTFFWVMWGTTKSVRPIDTADSTDKQSIQIDKLVHQSFFSCYCWVFSYIIFLSL